MKKSLALFISHSWSNYSQYEEFRSLLESLNWLRWRNLSIDRDNAFLTHGEGEEASLQELDILRQRLERLNTQLEPLRTALYKLERIGEGQRLEREIGERMLKAQESLFSGYMTKVESTEATRRREEFRARRGVFTGGDVRPEIAALTERKRKLTNEVDAIQRRITDIEAGLRTVRTVPYASRDILYSGGKVEPSAIRTDPNLVLLLRERISEADVVMVIAQPWHQYRMWLDCEFELAADLSKPLLAVLPTFQEKCPAWLRRRCSAVVPWQAARIGMALLELTSSQR